MALTNPPVAVSSFDSGRLAAGISATATTITISPIYKTVNGVRTKQGFDTTSGIALITHGDFTERVSFEGASVNATTKVTTLTTCTRGLSATSTSASFTGGTGRAWPKGAKFTVVADVSYFQSSVYTTVPNSFSAKQTFAAGADFTSVTRPPKLPTLSQAQENALTPEEGMMWKNSDTGTNRQYVGGSIVDIGDNGTPTATEAAEGKVELATSAEHDPATTGAKVVQAKNTRKNSTGAAEGQVVALNASAQVDSTLLPNIPVSKLNSGTDASSSTFWRGDGTWAEPSSGPVAVLTSTTVSTDGIASTTAVVDVSNTLLTIGANTLVAGRSYDFLYRGHNSHQNGSSFELRVNIGAVQLPNQNLNTNLLTPTTESWEVKGSFICISTGASGSIIWNVRYQAGKNTGELNTATVSRYEYATQAPVTLDTTVANVLKLTARTDISNAGSFCRCQQALVTRLG